HHHLQVVEQLRHLLGGGFVGLVLGGHPHLGRLLDDLLADEVHAGIELVDGSGSGGAGLGLVAQLGEQVLERFHASRLSGAWRCSAASALSWAMRWSMSSAPKTADPATKVSAPASAACAIVSGPMPPSTCSHTADPRRLASSASPRSLGIWSARKLWPPKPGSTVMTRIWSSSSSTSKSGSAGVSGLMATPARAPMARSRRARATGSDAASRWNVTDAAPISAYSGACRSASEIMRCTSSGMG